MSGVAVPTLALQGWGTRSGYVSRPYPQGGGYPLPGKSVHVIHGTVVVRQRLTDVWTRCAHPCCARMGHPASLRALMGGFWRRCSHPCCARMGHPLWYGPGLSDVFGGAWGFRGLKPSAPSGARRLKASAPSLVAPPSLHSGGRPGLSLWRGLFVLLPIHRELARR